jgi:DNA-binding NtrC family response regulator
LALEALRTRPFDLLLTDLMMPEMDGIALLQAALAIDDKLAIVLMTGQGTIGSAAQAMKVGALDYILKPFKLSFILPVLSRALEIRRLKMEIRNWPSEYASAPRRWKRQTKNSRLSRHLFLMICVIR